MDATASQEAVMAQDFSGRQLMVGDEVLVPFRIEAIEGGRAKLTSIRPSNSNGDRIHVVVAGPEADLITSWEMYERLLRSHES